MTPLHATEYEAMASFRYAMRKFLRFSKDYLAHSRLTPEQYEALLALRGLGQEEGVSVGQLSERLQVKPHTAVALTNKLVARKLITKERTPRDRREARVRLTRAGLELLEQVAATHREVIRKSAPEMLASLNRLR